MYEQLPGDEGDIQTSHCTNGFQRDIGDIGTSQCTNGFQGTYKHLSVRTASMGHTDIIPALGSGGLGSESVRQLECWAAGALGALCTGSIRHWSIMQWSVRQRQRWAESVSGSRSIRETKGGAA